MLLTRAGVQVPEYPLFEIVGRIGLVAPEHIGAIGVKVGIIFGLTVTVKLAVVAQSPAVGVKVYVPVAVLLTRAGFQVPVYPLFEVADKIGLVAPEHIGAIESKVGTMFGFTVTVKEALVAHNPAVGVKV